MRPFGWIVFLLFTVSWSYGAEFKVDMLHRKGKERVTYSQTLVRVNPGDTVKWIARDPYHNVEFVSGAVPEGVRPFKSPLSRDTQYTFTKPGIYVYKCTPHYGMGMVGVVVVGSDLNNFNEVQAIGYPPAARKRLRKIFASL